jgi:microcystin-dependent protein
MADPFVGEIRAVGFNYAPDGWLMCQGQVVNVNTYQALYALIGNQYGGVASEGTFGIPDLRGRSIIGVGNGLNLPPITCGEKTGQGQVTLTLSQMPIHTHAATVGDPGHSHSAALPAHTHTFNVPCDTTGVASSPSPSGAFLSTTAGIDLTVNNLITNINSQAQTTLSPVSPATQLYAANANATMGQGTTGPATSTGPSATSSSTTGVGVTLSSAGGTAPVSTQSPALGVFYMIATIGIFPPHP